MTWVIIRKDLALQVNPDYQVDQVELQGQSVNITVDGKEYTIQEAVVTRTLKSIGLSLKNGEFHIYEVTLGGF
jgi:hypothetical protein